MHMYIYILIHTLLYIGQPINSITTMDTIRAIKLTDYTMTINIIGTGSETPNLAGVGPVKFHEPGTHWPRNG